MESEHRDGVETVELVGRHVQIDIRQLVLYIGPGQLPPKKTSRKCLADCCVTVICGEDSIRFYGTRCHERPEVLVKNMIPAHPSSNRCVRLKPACN